MLCHFVMKGNLISVPSFFACVPCNYENNVGHKLDLQPHHRAVSQREAKALNDSNIP